MSVKNFELELDSNYKILVETGKLAQQCNGSCVMTVGKTKVLATCALSREAREGVDFLPLMVNYQEKYYATGKIGGNRYQRREARPPVDKILMGRLIDRGIRPMLPKSLRRDIQVMPSILAYDMLNSHDIVATNASSLAVAVSDCPMYSPLGTVRVGLIDDKLIINPNEEQRLKSDLDLVVTSSKEDVVMIEVQANEIVEDKLLEAINKGNEAGKKIALFFEKIVAEVGKEKFEVIEIQLPEDVYAFVESDFSETISDAIYNISGKLDRFRRFGEIKLEAKEKVAQKFDDEEKEKMAGKIVDKLISSIIRKNILKEGRRIAGRKLDEIRKLTCELDLVPLTHGSALFQRGETQGLTITTLGGPSSVMTVEGIEGELKKRYFHHYNFPPFSVGEASNRLSTSNRELGHGNLAEKALLPVLPSEKEFPYTIRTVTEILQSNGSSSMAATCGSTLSLMAAGVPIKTPVAGIALGLMTDPDSDAYKILTDLQDEEDFGGDMDFKVTGTATGVTALQMDIKVKGLSEGLLKEALDRAKKGRLEILEVMLEAIPTVRPELSEYAPRLYNIKIDTDQIRVVIGKGGETINKIIDETGVEIDISDKGEVVITSSNASMAEKAVEWVKRITAKPEVGKIYDGKVVKLMDFGAFVQFMPGQDGLVHISMISDKRIEKVEDILKVGQEVKVKVLAVDPTNGRIRLSMKDAR